MVKAKGGDILRPLLNKGKMRKSEARSGYRGTCVSDAGGGMNEVKRPPLFQGNGSAQKKIAEIAEHLVSGDGSFSLKRRVLGTTRIIGRVENDEVIPFTGKLEVAKIAMYRDKTVGKTVYGDVPFQEIKKALVPLNTHYALREVPVGEQKRDDAITSTEV